MKSPNKGRETELDVWETYYKEWVTASSEKRIELDKRMSRWQELMKCGLTVGQAYHRAMQEESGQRIVEEPSDKRPAISSSPRTRKAPLVVLSLALLAAIVYGFVTNGDRDAIDTKLKSVQSVLASTQQTLASTATELSRVNGNLASVQSELSSTKQTLTSTQTQLSSTKQSLTSTQSELVSTKQTLSSIQSELSSTKQTLASASTNFQATLSATQKQLAVAQETLEGLGITLSASKECSDVKLIDNHRATNPTMSQLMAFVIQDRTEQHTYTKGVYDCSQFSRDVHNNAEAAGIRAAEVQIRFRNESIGHALNAFLTTDYGLVYVDCTGAPDTFARVKAGKEYRAVQLGNLIWVKVRDDDWWDALGDLLMGHKVISNIEIYW